MVNSKTCSLCKSNLPLDNFYKAKKSADGHQSRCKSCQSKVQKQLWETEPEKCREASRRSSNKNLQTRRERSREYYWANKETLAQKKRIYQLENPEIPRLATAKRRAIKLQAKSFLITLDDQLRLRAQPCIYCGQKSEHLDHIIPLSRGGSHGIGNLAPSCQPCNNSKKDRFVMEWKKSQPKVILNKKKEGN